jgi:hypothetical protein
MLRNCRFLALGLLASLTLLVARPAKAGLLIEPYLGYELGTYSYTSITPNENYDFSSANLGARVGYAFPIVFVAADYSVLLGANLKNGPSGSSEGTATGNQLFVDVGASLPLIRFYGGYGLTNTLTQTTNSIDAKAEGGTAFKLGVGTTILPIVAINLEYIHSEFDKLNGDSAGKSKANFYMLSVSLPFNLN